MRQDIISALKNAIERGSSIEQAKQSLLNSGYKQEEIDEAANYFSGAKPEAMQVEQEPTKKQSLDEQELPEVPSELLPEPPIEQAQKPAPEIKTREQIVSKITSELQNQKLPESPEIKKTEQQEQKQEKPKRSAGLIILFIILVILLGITLFIFFAKDTFFGLFGQVVKRLG